MRHEIRLLTAMFGAFVWGGGFSSVHAQELKSSNPGAPVLRFEAPREPVGSDRFWGSAEYLLWLVKGQDAPPLVTIGPVGQATFPGILGRPDTSIALGDERLEQAPFSGGRFALGAWFETENRFGLEAAYLFIGRQAASRSVSSPGTPPLSIPFFDVTVPGEDTTGLASTAQLFSGAAVLSHSTRLQGAEANGIVGLVNHCNCRLDGLIGFRWLNLDETLSFDTSSPSIPPIPASFFFTHDQFQTRNDFYGGQIGLRGEADSGRFFVQAAAKVALGSMSQTTRIAGSTFTDFFQAPGNGQTFPGGYFAQPTNIGSHQRAQFAVVPEVNLNVGVHLTERIRLSAGYSFLYLSSVARPGDQIDRGLNPTQAPSISGNPFPALVGPARPTYLGNDSSFWAHGFNFGVEVRY